MKAPIISSIAYIIVIFTIIFIWSCISDKIKLNEFGDFLAGLFAPLAFFWLAFGYWQNNKSINLQSKELNNSVNALQLQTKEMQEANKTSGQQLKLIESNERHTQRELFLKYSDMITKELEASAKIICKNTNIKIFNSAFSTANTNHTGHGDVLFMMNDLADNTLKNRENLDDESLNHAESFVSKYESMINLAKEYDKQGELEKLFERSSYEYFYKALTKYIY